MSEAGQESGRFGDEPMRIVIVEDSDLMASALTALCEEDGSATVVARERHGVAAVETIDRLRPDLVTLDLGLPDIDGFAVLERVMATTPTPVLILTATLNPTWRKEAYHALTIGAVDVMKKPGTREINDPEWRRRFRDQLRFVALVPVVRHIGSRKPRRRPAKKPAVIAATVANRLIVVTGSAGSPRALETIGRQLREHMPLGCPLLIAIHLGEGMETPLARYLTDTLGSEVVVAHDGLRLRPEIVAVAPGRRHVEVNGDQSVRVLAAGAGDLLAPSLDRLLRSVAHAYGRGAAAVALSGMGTDGASGMAEVRRAGGMTLAQDEASCVVYGIPRAAVEVGAVQHQGPPALLSDLLVEWLG